MNESTIAVSSQAESKKESFPKAEVGLKLKKLFSSIEVRNRFDARTESFDVHAGVFWGSSLLSSGLGPMRVM